MKYFYRDFSTKKMRYTRGQFIGWTQPTGLLNVRYAIFRLKSSDLLIPEYCIPQETRLLLDAES